MQIVLENLRMNGFLFPQKNGGKSCAVNKKYKGVTQRCLIPIQLPAAKKIGAIWNTPVTTNHINKPHYPINSLCEKATTQRTDFIIDKLTNSIENSLTCEVFDTEIVRMANADAKRKERTQRSAAKTKQPT